MGGRVREPRGIMKSELLLKFRPNSEAEKWLPK
jgi:hypothetical protein